MTTIFLDISNFKGILKGSWTDTTASGGFGKWTIDGTDFQGLYRPSTQGTSIDVYTDFNRNGTIDVNDKVVGNATFATTTSGGRGTWTWDVTQKRGDYFGTNGQDVGDVTISNFDFLSTGVKLDASLSVRFSSTPKEGAGVFTTSINLSAGTTTSGNLAEGAPVWWKVTGITEEDLTDGALTGTGIITNGTLDFQHSLRTDADSGELFAIAVYSDSARTQQIGITTSAVIAEAHVVRGNSIYTIVDGPSWTQAEANSVKLGGHLVTLNDASEQGFIQSSIMTSSTMWIGNTDVEQEGTWKWISGQQVSYTNWQPGEPNNQNDEDYGTIYATGKWNDGHVSGLSKGIAETPFIRRGDSAYVIVQGPTWEEAEANAVKLGGHLVTINDAAENEWLKSNFNSYISQSSGGADFWIGYTDIDQEGTWKWLDGSPSTYTNWGGAGPNNRVGSYPTYDPVYTSAQYWLGAQAPSDPAGEDFADFNAVHGMWNDVAHNHRDASVGIAEIKLAPNNTPTGTPTLSGTAKVGQVIAIDKTPIQDADNFTGYTPEFKYSWEVSSNGTTWTPLTSADATDNNTSYTITTAEVAKQVRGVVSYLDGYGTQEAVPTTASAAIAPSAPAVQSLTLTAPGRTTLRSGTSTTSSIAYNVSTGDTALTGIGASLYFDSSQLTVSTAGTPFQNGLLGNAISADTNNVDGDPKTDKVLALSYADFGGQFPGAGTTLPLTLANLNLVPTASYTGTTLHLKGSPATGFTAIGADLTLAYNAAPTVNGTIPAISTNRGKAFSYTVPSTLFSDADSTLTLSASSSTGTALPSWLSFNAATRTLSGTPTTGGTLSLNINAADELGSVSAPLTLKVREVQQLSSSTAPLRYQRNKDLTVPINYSTSDASSSTGLAFKVHFNSSLFSFDPSTGVSNKAQADLFQVGTVQLDTTDSDNDPTTDRYIPINIASFTGQFPSAGAPTKLADLTFRSADKAIDPLTGLRDTSINFSETEAAQGYGFLGSSATLKPLSFSLDVDRDGKVTALGDGLMVIRYLFGAAFAGAALTDKAISPDSPLLGGVPYTSMTPQQKADVAAQVAANIQEGIDSKALDVDKDNKITALGDGLMVIRRLFGAAFDGAALTNKAISPDSPYFGPPADFTAVAANIDALINNLIQPPSTGPIPTQPPSNGTIVTPLYGVGLGNGSSILTPIGQ